VSFAAMALYVTSQRVFVVVDFVIDSVQKLLDILSYKPVAKKKKKKKPKKMLQCLPLLMHD